MVIARAWLSDSVGSPPQSFVRCIIQARPPHLISRLSFAFPRLGFAQVERQERRRPRGFFISSSAGFAVPPLAWPAFATLALLCILAHAVRGPPPRVPSAVRAACVPISFA